MITIRNLRAMLDDFSDNDLVEAYEFEKDDDQYYLWNILGVFKGGLNWVQGKLPTGDEPPIGMISTNAAEVTVFTVESDGE
ncbi:hypothetical protein LCGC14_1904210 [marine sediment metagenome]|uniref:Uncharacterized protein n=1 Tax=marine sediment metagenome TaxID=412755 RepID=A0A0F9FVZ3_9ZZZZ